jgi:hypothetical protein
MRLTYKQGPTHPTTTYHNEFPRDTSGLHLTCTHAQTHECISQQCTLLPPHDRCSGIFEHLSEAPSPSFSPHHVWTLSATSLTNICILSSPQFAPSVSAGNHSINTSPKPISKCSHLRCLDHHSAHQVNHTHPPPARKYPCCPGAPLIC